MKGNLSGMPGLRSSGSKGGGDDRSCQQKDFCTAGPFRAALGWHCKCNRCKSAIRTHVDLLNIYMYNSICDLEADFEHFRNISSGKQL